MCDNCKDKCSDIKQANRNIEKLFQHTDWSHKVMSLVAIITALAFIVAGLMVLQKWANG